MTNFWRNFRDAVAGVLRPKPPPSTPSPGAMMAKLNAQRAVHGNLPPLAEDAGLDATAQKWAERMAQARRLDHGNWYARIMGVHPNTAAAEDIGQGYTSVDAMVAGWMASPGHRANILGNYNRAGIGWATGRDSNIYWCLDLDKYP